MPLAGLISGRAQNNSGNSRPALVEDVLPGDLQPRQITAFFGNSPEKQKIPNFLLGSPPADFALTNGCHRTRVEFPCLHITFSRFG